MKITFEKFNETANYYSKTSRTTGKNVWNQDEIQKQFMGLISECNLTQEQIEKLETFMVENNATIDMEASKNNSVQEFSEIAISKKQKNSKTKVA